MKLLLIGPEVKDLHDARNFSGVWSYYLAREFRRRGIALRFAPQQKPADALVHYQSMSLGDINHIVALGTRYFTKVPHEVAKELRRRCRGAVTQVHDGPMFSDLVDCTFMVRDDPRAYERKRECYGSTNHYVGWAADPELCSPQQPPDEIRILIDHPNLAKGRVDLTERVLFEVWDCARVFTKKVRVRRIVDGGVVDYNGDELEVEPFHRKGIAYPDICFEYSQAHLFLVTHPESVGMSVLETAMAGALPVVPNGFISPDRLATVRACVYEGAIPWGRAVGMIDIEQSRERALANSWQAVVNRMLSYFEKFKK
jgi:hypothetical protein